MLLSTLDKNSIVQIILDKLNINEVKALEIADFLKLYNSGNFIYISTLKAKFKMTTKEIYLILNELEKRNILECLYIVNCDECDNDIIYNIIKDIPEAIECEKCGEPLIALERAKMVFRVF